jgi:hypothetical protein
MKGANRRDEKGMHTKGEEETERRKFLRELRLNSQRELQY